MSYLPRQAFVEHYNQKQNLIENLKARLLKLHVGLERSLRERYYQKPHREQSPRCMYVHLLIAQPIDKRSAIPYPISPPVPR